ncbi:aminotransferase class III-fold pyridoxal phosphate-dependent enzyme, partial [Salmonella enterica subsp. enterica serovar Montevideo]|nr:aminotransferase class III-fold pyridoxal phosphate-dependent enzyme [Salmonella enterica subsp. enterica serovar Montevideo]
TFAKSIAGGFPLAGVTGRADVMDAIAPGGLGGTYAGNPIACAKDPSQNQMKNEFYPLVEKKRLFEEGYLAARSGHSRGSTLDL